jgi:hypothetical protein
LVEQLREQQRDDELQGDVDEQKVKGVGERSPDERVVDEQADVAESDVAHRCVDVPPMKDQDEREGERVAEKDDGV